MSAFGTVGPGRWKAVSKFKETTPYLQQQECLQQQQVPAAARVLAAAFFFWDRAHRMVRLKPAEVDCGWGA